MQPFITIRTARPDELAAIISVDDDACRRYATAGLTMNLHDGHPFVVKEQARWARSLASGDSFIAEDAAHRAIGIAVLGRLDAEPYLDQLSVRLEHVGQGVGSALLSQAITWARGRGPGLWLNIYRLLPWNRPSMRCEDLPWWTSRHGGPRCGRPSRGNGPAFRCRVSAWSCSGLAADGPLEARRMVCELDVR